MRSLVVLLLAAAVVLAVVQPPVVTEVIDKSTVNVLPNGDANVKEEISMSAAAFARFRAYYSPLSMLTRELKSHRLDAEFVDVNINVDEANNRVTVTYTIKGAAVNKKDFWELRVANPREKVTLSSQSGNTLVFTYIKAVTSDLRWMFTITVNLPEGSRNVRFIEDENVLRYEYSPLGVGVSISPLLLAGIVIIAVGTALFFVGGRRK
ncbi:MAG: hypothetical protein ACK4SY_05115 [Pyrobaculum sp.]